MSSPSEPNAGTIDPLLSRVIAGNFRIERLLGSGAMGNVYKAEQLSLGKAVAIKVLHPHLMGDDKLVLRFKREAKNASMLNHPNSIQIIDSGQDKDGTFYIAMELLTGRDLAHVIRDDFPLSVARIVRIMSQVLSALDEAHTQGVIHRDLKPSNIMLIERRGESDFVKVCDFGIAKAAHNEKDDRENMLTIQGLVCGTPEYMAPEQARGELLDGRADLYAAAVILFQMVTGDIPFKGDTPMAIVSRHLVEQPVVPSGRRNDVPIPPALDALILKGMEKNRELRFPTAVIFREALDAIDPSGLPPRRGSSASNLRAQMPTARISGTSATAMVPSSDPANHFGVTTQLPRRSRTRPLVAALGLLLAGATALIVRAQRVETDPPAAAEPALETALVTTPPAADPPARAAVPGPPPAPAAAAAAPATSAAPTATATAATEDSAAGPPANPPAPAAPRPAHKRKAPEKVSAGEPAPVSATARSGTTTPAAPATTAAAAIAPASLPAPLGYEKAEPAQRGPREVLGEGERLLGQGEVRDACEHGEEAKRMNPKLAAVYKFLGKCYNRAGSAGQANDNYKKYLELAPNASDAMFIQSILK